jgi:hypothetical protein
MGNPIVVVRRCSASLSPVPGCAPCVQGSLYTIYDFRHGLGNLFAHVGANSASVVYFDGDDAYIMREVESHRICQINDAGASGQEIEKSDPGEVAFDDICLTVDAVGEASDRYQADSIVAQQIVTQTQNERFHGLVPSNLL